MSVALIDSDYRLMLEALADAVIVANSENEIIYANPSIEALLGWSASVLVGQPLTILIPSRLRADHLKGFRRFMATREPRMVGRATRVPALRPDGSEIDVEMVVSSLQVDGEDLFVATFRDLLARVDLERRITLTRYLKATARAAGRLNTQLDLDHVLETFVETMVSDLHAALAHVWIHDPPTHTLRLTASAGRANLSPQSVGACLDATTSPDVVGQVARTRKPIVVNDLDDAPGLDTPGLRREGIAAVAALPLLIGDELHGVLVHFSDKPLTGEIVDALTAFTAIVSAALNDFRMLDREQAASIEADEQRQKLQTILDMLPIAVILAEGPEGHLSVSNPAASEILGEPMPHCTLEEFFERYPLETIDGRPLAPEERPLGRTFHEGERVRDTVRFRRADGHEFVLDVVAAPFPGPSGGAVLCFRDVTARLRLESELAERAAQLHALLHYLPVGVAYFDELAVCRASNGPAQRILGRSRTAVIGASAHDLFAHAPELRDAVARCVADRTPHAQEGVPWPASNGSTAVRYLDWRFEPLPNGPEHSPGALALVVDVTDHKRFQDELRLAKEAAELTSRNKSKFLSAVSHDLRTPVNAISLLVELLERKVVHDGHSDQELQELTADLRQVASNLVELINDLLDLSRFDSGDVVHHASDFELDSWLAATLGPLQRSAWAKGLAFSWHSDQPGRIVRADRIKLGRVLTNLAGNAVKFTEHGGVQVRAGADAEGWVVLEVRDTGPGIPSEQLDRIFDEFAQLRNPERDRTKGTGLGLAICRRLVESAGGRLHVASQPGVGSTFTARYPPEHLPSDARVKLVASGPSAATAVPHLATPDEPILLVEDDANSRDALALLLQHNGYPVVTASDGFEALEFMQQIRPRLILLDLMLPGMDGMELLRQMRLDPKLSDLPVVVLSGDVLSHRSDEMQCFDVAGALAKPVDMRELLEVLHRLIPSQPVVE